MRVHTITKSTQAKFKDHTFPCTKCSEPIRAGQKFYMYQPNHQQPRRSHAEHGSIKQSELCQGKMSGVYAAVEGLEEAIAQARNSNDASGLADALRDCAQEVEQVKDEYQEGYDNLPQQFQDSGSGAETQEKIEALEQFCESLESAASECEDVDSEDEPDVPADHSEDCPVYKMENGEPEEEGGAVATEATCDCGKDDKESEHDQWETDREEAIESACATAENVAGELSI